METETKLIQPKTEECFKVNITGGTETAAKVEKKDKDDDKCYLPNPFQRKGAVTKNEPMGPIGPWATGKTSFSPTAGMTGIRPVVDCYSITQTNIDLWQQRNAAILNDAKDLYERSADNAIRSRKAVAELKVIVENAQKATTESLIRRKKEIKTWKITLKEAIKLMQDEIVELEQQKLRLKKSLIVFQTPESIAGECLVLRSLRPETELLRDPVEKELIKEKALIYEIRLKLMDAIKEFEQQQIANRASRERLEYDWSGKTVSFKIDKKAASLNNASKTILFYPGAMRAPPEQASGAYWKYFSEQTLNDCEETRKQSMKLRESLKTIAHKAIDDLRKQAAMVQKAFELRVKCLEENIERLIKELRTCLLNLVDTEKRIEELKAEIASFTTALKVAQTRMELRNRRENVENCRDIAQQQLIDEVKINQDGVAGLYKYLDAAEQCKVDLINIRSRLEREIMLKRKALFQDRDRCMSLRRFYPTEESMRELV